LQIGRETDTATSETSLYKINLSLSTFYWISSSATCTSIVYLYNIYIIITNNQYPLCIFVTIADSSINFEELLRALLAQLDLKT
jgi:hypothetical protein